ncbi:MAG: PQQ-like beta-propeller repeat protein [Acidobacteria bacterium]|nr:PQQ-like beta-propeller repeat protein [Acidobacteriota bacterium]
MNIKSYIGTAMALLLLLSPAFGQVDSQWRGPNRDGKYPEKNLLTVWPEEGPALIWSAEDLGEGFSSAAVTADRVYITGLFGSSGFLSALDHSGKLLWKKEYGKEWSGSHPGARTTPTVVGNRIYLMSAFGLVVCFDRDGKMVWSLDLQKQYKAPILEWGMTESLLIDGDRLFCTPGGPAVMMAVLDRHTGKVLQEIKGNGQASGYCSPCLIRHGGRRLVLTMTAKSVVAVDADSGEYLWKQPHVTDYDVNANTPLYIDGRVYVVSGYGTGGQMFQPSADGSSTKKVWANGNPDSQMGSIIALNGTIFGSGHNNRGWHAVDWTTGETLYSQRAIGNKGNLIYADGLLYAYSERGDVALVKPDQENFTVISSFPIQAGSGPHWAHPVIKDGRLYVRHGNTLLVYQIGN